MCLSTHKRRVNFRRNSYHFPVKINELAKKIGVSRQWLNKMVDRRMIPGVSRSEVTGRLMIADDSKLDPLLVHTKQFRDAMRDATRELRETIRRLRRVPIHQRRATRREFSRTTRTATLIPACSAVT